MERNQMLNSTSSSFIEFSTVLEIFGGKAGI